MAIINGTAVANLLNGTALNDTINGLAGNDTLSGGAGNDRLDGGLGNDSMVGGLGNDLYIVNSLLDKVVEAAGAGSGVDTIQSSVTFTLPVNVEHLTLTGAANINGTGNTVANNLTGNAGVNLLSGLGGNDLLNGGAGADTLSGGAGNDILVWDAADALVDGGAGTDTLRLTGTAALDLRAVADSTITNVEAIDLAGTNVLTLAASDVLAISGTTDILRVAGFVGDAVVAGAGWLQGTNTLIGGQTYAQYTKGGATLQVDLDVDRSGITLLEPVIQLSGLDGSNGFLIEGGANNDFAGTSVASAGDVNGDGYDDVIVGATGVGNDGAAYVLFGGADGFADVNLGAPLGSAGFRIVGAEAGANAGRSVSSAGDLNGDGYDDLVIGDNAYGSPATGAAFVVFGKAGGFGEVDLGALGSNGFRITGEAMNDNAGMSVASAGDVNGDGYADIIVGAGASNVGGTDSGAAYVLFGGSEGFTDIDLTALSGAEGFRIIGASNGHLVGSSVSSAGDINGDGFDDLVVGARGYYYNDPGAGASYVIFGKSSFTNIDLLNPLGSNGFFISGHVEYDYGGYSVSSAGDVNGDGFDDLIIGARGYGASDAGAAYVVFGKASGFGNLDVTGLGSNGFRITGMGSGTYHGTSVSSAGDVNGDGFDDVIVGSSGYGSWVVFGKSSGFGNIDLSALSPVDGFRIVGEPGASGDAVSSAGDVNGDGYDDLIVGGPNASTIGTANGAGYVLFGRDFRGDASFAGGAGDDSLTGTAAGEVIVGGQGNDTLTGGAGADVLRGGGGDDVLVYDAADRQVNGGAGYDTLTITGSGAALDLTLAANAKVAGIEAIDLTGSGNNSLTIDAAGLVSLTEGFHVLRVSGNAGDSVSAGDGWTYTGNITSGGQTYAQYQQGAALLQVDTDITRDVGFSIELSQLGAGSGFRITGGQELSFSGMAVSSAGDVNADGFADFIIGAFGDGASGAAYVVFGKGSGFTGVDLGNLGSGGFRIIGAESSDNAGESVSAAGDVNGDGYDDVIVGAPGNGSGDHGAAYVVFGKASGFADVDLASLGGAGFGMLGGSDGDRAGIATASAGDVNGDGYEDVIVGATGLGANEGAAFLVFGSADPGLVVLDSVGADEVMMTVAFADTFAGRSVSSAGDVNGDGFDDLVIGTDGSGAGGGGAAFVVFGSSSGLSGILDLNDLDDGGFRILGADASDGAGTSVASAGDFNGDGFDDLVVGAPFYGPSNDGAAYVVFGGSGGFADVDLDDPGDAGFRILGGVRDAKSGISVASAGDVNGDGYDDIIIGSSEYGDYTNSGATYVIFGKGSGFGDIDLGNLGDAGFRIVGQSPSDYAGISVSSAGDVNGDGFDDLLVGAYGYEDATGASYVVFGRDFRGEVDFTGGAGNDNYTGTAAAENIVGGRGNDTLVGGGGADVLKGGAGDDVLVWDAADFRVDGGGGFDTLRVTGAGKTVNPGDAFKHIEAVDLTGSGNNALALSVADLLDLDGDGWTLRVDGNAGDRVVSTGQGWTVGEEIEIGANLYQAYTKGTATLLVDTDLTQIIS